MKPLLLIAILLFQTACLYAVRYDATYKGKIVDAETGEPIEGVVVLGEWDREYPTPAGAVHKFYDTKETVTDKNGDFEIPGVGLRVFTNIIPMNVLIFKAGYQHIGMGPWESFKEDGGLLMKKVKWDGDKAIIPLKKLTVEEMGKPGTYPPLPPGEAPLKNIKKMLLEINKYRTRQGGGVIDIWGGEKVYEKDKIR